MKTLHWKLFRYADGSIPIPPAKGADDVCRECLSKPETFSDYFGDPDCETIVSDCTERNAHCALCGEKEETA